MSSTKVQRTYLSSRTLRQKNPPSSPVSELHSSPPPPSPARTNRPSRDYASLKRPLNPENAPDNKLKRVKLASDSITNTGSTKTRVTKPKTRKKQTFTQLQLVPDQPLLRTCSLCSLSYIRGAADDESLHRAHCSRVRRGMEWGKEEERQLATIGGRETVSRIRLKDGTLGRIISFRADASGKVGHKLATLLETINRTLSAPPLPMNSLRESKAYLFLASGKPGEEASASSREKIIGCVIAQRITTALKLASAADCTQPMSSHSEMDTSHSASASSNEFITIDSPSPHNSHHGLFAHPDPLPTPLGISRIMVASSHRRQGVASALLNSVLQTFIYGCTLDPKRGDVAFTQPTGDGGALMSGWGGGSVRVYSECG